MIPTIWSYLLKHYFRVVLFCTLAFVSILLIMRLDEIAHFAALGAPASTILWFALYQIPYVLPIALPLSALISAILLVKKLSDAHELTALRAAGFSLKDILLPILLTATLFSLFNFYVVSELATQSHLSTTLMKNELRAINPLLLLSNNRLMRMRGLHYEALGPTQLGESAQNIFLAIPTSDDKITLLTAKKLQLQEDTLIADHVAMVTPLKKNEDAYSDLLVENIGQSQTALDGFSQLIQKGVWTLSTDHLPMSLLLAQLQSEKELLLTAEKLPENEEEAKALKRSVNRTYSDILRRFSLGFAVLTFTFTGAAFGINISRRPSSRRLIAVVALATFFIVTFFAAKGVSHTLISSSLLYIMPHILMIGLAVWMISRANKGIET